MVVHSSFAISVPYRPWNRFRQKSSETIPPNGLSFAKDGQWCLVGPASVVRHLVPDPPRLGVATTTLLLLVVMVVLSCLDGGVGGCRL